MNIKKKNRMPVICALIAVGFIIFSMGVTVPGSTRLIKIYGRVIVDEDDTSVPKPVPNFYFNVYKITGTTQQLIGRERTDAFGAFGGFFEIPSEYSKEGDSIVLSGIARLKREEVYYKVRAGFRLDSKYSYELNPKASLHYSAPSTGLEIPFLITGRISFVLVGESIESAVENATIRVSVFNFSNELESRYYSTSGHEGTFGVLGCVSNENCTLKVEAIYKRYKVEKTIDLRGRGRSGSLFYMPAIALTFNNVEPIDFTETDSRDSDTDGLLDALETRLGTDPRNSDTDRDGISDGDEYNRYRTDPKNPDTDGDGLTDGAEITMGANPINQDTDGDNLSDGEEVNAYFTSPNVPDAINLARLPSVIVSASSRFGDYYNEYKVIDGGLGGDGGIINNPSNQEWATAGERAGAWIEIRFPRPVPVKRIKLYDRRNTIDNVARFTVLIFNSDSPAGILENMGPLEDGDSSRPANPYQVELAGILGTKVTGVMIQITAVSPSSANIGLAEVEVYNN